jgi:hypothetical protein
MATTAIIGIRVKKIEIWACHTQHVEAVRVVSVDKINLHLLRRNHLYVGSVKAPSNRREPAHLEKPLCQIAAILWPTYEFIFEVI